MTLKKLLGIESSPLSEMEIMGILEDAYHRNLHMVEFPGKDKKTVRVTIKGINVEGIMNGYEGKYESS